MLYLFFVYSDISSIVFSYAVVDAIAFFVGYGMLRKLNMLISWKFAVCLAVVIAGNILINFLLFRLELINALLFAIVVFAILALFISAISKIIFTVDIREAYLIGLLIGLINTLMSIITGPPFFD